MHVLIEQFIPHISYIPSFFLFFSFLLLMLILNMHFSGLMFHRVKDPVSGVVDYVPQPLLDVVVSVILFHSLEPTK